MNRSQPFNVGIEVNVSTYFHNNNCFCSFCRYSALSTPGLIAKFTKFLRRQHKNSVVTHFSAFVLQQPVRLAERWQTEPLGSCSFFSWTHSWMSVAEDRQDSRVAERAGCFVVRSSTLVKVRELANLYPSCFSLWCVETLNQGRKKGLEPARVSCS